jgi:AICAR transformylase/IMP cyclohydrolase PurH
MNIELKYGCNPHQKPAYLGFKGESPLKVLNGNPGYINLLDAFNAWQLAKELKAATGKPGAASFKHVSPAGAAIAKPLTSDYLRSQFTSPGDYSDVASAYIRARGGDRMCSYGDVAAVSEVVDESLALFLKTEICDLIIAPGYDSKALEILRQKKKGDFVILQMDPDYDPPETEARSVYGFDFTQRRNDARIDRAVFANVVSKRRDISEAELESLIVATIALKYTQSNSVCVAYDDQVIGMGAGQQSRVHCTRLACAKADKWMLQQSPSALALEFADGLKKVDRINAIDQLLLWDELSESERRGLRASIKGEIRPIPASGRQGIIKGFGGVSLSSDAFIPFRDNVDRASRSNVSCIAHAGEALRDDAVTAAANEYGMAMVHTGLRLFTH